jgi:hypothetical protein
MKNTKDKGGHTTVTLHALLYKGQTALGSLFMKEEWKYETDTPARCCLRPHATSYTAGWSELHTMPVSSTHFQEVPLRKYEVYPPQRSAADRTVLHESRSSVI